MSNFFNFVSPKYKPNSIQIKNESGLSKVNENKICELGTCVNQEVTSDRTQLEQGK